MKLFQRLIKVLKKFGINANKIELSANDILNLLAGNEINLSSKKITIKSDNFSVDKNGIMKCVNAILNGAKIVGNYSENDIPLEITSEKDGGYYKTQIAPGEIKLKWGNDILELYPNNLYLKYYSAGAGAEVLQCLQKYGYYVECNGESSSVSYDGIETPKLVVNGEGKAMYGKTLDHMYRCHWTGSQLQFWVDETNVGTLSDKRLKKEIKDIDDDFVKIINEVEMKQFKVANRNGLISFGILAQDLMEIFTKYNKNPLDYELVQETLYKDDDETTYYTINYEQFLILKQRATDMQIKQLGIRLKEMEEKFNEINRLDK